jgi:hypothetical protein
MRFESAWADEHKLAHDFNRGRCTMTTDILLLKLLGTGRRYFGSLTSARVY